MPAFSGLFAPHWRDDARGVIVGIINNNIIIRKIAILSQIAIIGFIIINIILIVLCTKYNSSYYNDEQD